MRNATRRRLDRMGKVFKPHAGISPERMEEIYRLLDNCVVAAGGQRPNESKLDAVARLFGLPRGADLIQQLRDRTRCGETCDGD